MPRPKLIRSEKFAYHVCVRSNNKEWFYIPDHLTWPILTSTLSKAAEKYGAEIHTLVQMSNHFHLILSTPLANIDRVMCYFLTQTTRKIQNDSGRINHVFGDRYKWTLLDSPYSLAYVMKYVLRNPVRAGMVEKVEDYRYSTLSDLSALPLVEGFSNYWRYIPKNFIERLEWLNRPTPKECEALIGKALRRFRFNFAKSSGDQKLLRDLREVYRVEPHDS